MNFKGIVVCKDKTTYDAIAVKDPNKLYVVEGENIKLYQSTGQNTDGAMTQKTVTDLIGDIEAALQTIRGV